jgi:flagellar motor switch protein FliN/FliY
MAESDEAETALDVVEDGSVRPGKRSGSAVLGVPIEVVVSVGRARPLVSDLVSLRRDSVLPLDSRIDDPVEILIGDRLIARGELQEAEDGSGRLAVRLTEVADLSRGV